MKWAETILGNIFKITSGGTPSRDKIEYYIDGKIPWVKTGDLKTKYLYDTEEYINELGLKNSSAQLFPKNTVLIALYGATIGACSILKIQASTNQACAAILPNKEIDEDYFYYYISFIKPQLILQGVGGAQPNISGKILKNTKIPLPPLDIQKKIAAILDKADQLRQKRKQAIEKLDQLIQSVFVDMFGDPVSNPKGWKIGKLKDYLAIPLNSGWSPECSNEAGGISVFSLANLKEYELSSNISKYYYGEHPKKGVDLEVGDILMSRSNTRDLVCRSGMYKGLPKKVIYPDLMIRIRVNKNIITPIFFEKYLQNNNVKTFIQRLAVGTSGSMVKISQEKLMNINIIIPDIEIQNKYNKISEKLEIIKYKINQDINIFNTLFSSLLHKAFRGELKFNNDAFKELEETFV